MTMAIKSQAAMLKTPLHSIFSRTVLLITFTGRKSGRTFTTPVNYIREGDRVLLSVEGKWARNFSEPADVQLRIAGESYRGTAIADPDPVRAERTFRQIMATDRNYAKHSGIAIDPAGNPTAEAMAASIGRGRVTVEITL